MHGGGAEPVLLGKAHIAKAVVPVLEEIDLSTEELEPGTEEEVQPVVEEAVQESAGPAKNRSYNDPREVVRKQRFHPLVDMKTNSPWGVDLSQFNGTVDWDMLKQQGPAFTFIKATEGATIVDTSFAENWNAAKGKGIIRSPYHFFAPKTSTVQAQIDNFCTTIGKLEVGDLPPVLDVESHKPTSWKGLSQQAAADLVIAWLKGVKQRLGVSPILYVNPNVCVEVLGNDPRLGDWILWLALYTTNPTPIIPKPFTAWTFWQYTKTGNVKGVVGDVDIDRFNGDSDGLEALRIK